MKIDFHSHILPAMDDGARDIAESLALLGMLKADGVDAVIATPHLYLHRDSPASFLERRARCHHELIQAGGGNETLYPKIILGCEVYYTDELRHMRERLPELCIEGTDYLLLEIPYIPLTSAFVSQIDEFVKTSCKGLNVVLAHIERYYEFNAEDIAEKITALGLLCQCNCDSLLTPRGRANLTRLLESGDVQFLGTDLHGVRYRPPVFAYAESFIRERFPDGKFECMLAAAEMALRNESPENILAMFK